MSPKTNPWQAADDLSDRIVELVNKTLHAGPAPEPLQVLAGQLLALKALESTMPVGWRPPTVRRLFAAIDAALRHMLSRGGAE